MNKQTFAYALIVSFFACFTIVGVITSFLAEDYDFQYQGDSDMYVVFPHYVIDYISEIYEAHPTWESSFCFQIDEDNVVFDIARREDSFTGVQFDVDNNEATHYVKGGSYCRGRYIGFLHTHPPQSGSWSDFDIEQNKKRPLSCLFRVSGSDYTIECDSYGQPLEVYGEVK